MSRVTTLPEITPENQAKNELLLYLVLWACHSCHIQQADIIIKFKVERGGVGIHLCQSVVYWLAIAKPQFHKVILSGAKNLEFWKLRSFTSFGMTRRTVLP
jgi:hypothetical protein